MPLLITQRVQAARIEALAAEIAEIRADLSRSAAGAVAAPQTLAAPVHVFQDPRLVLGAGIGACFSLLLTLHWLMVIRADVAAVVFRLVCIVVPFAIATSLSGLWRNPLRRLLVSAAPLGVAAALAMSYLVSIQDGTPVLPRSGRDLFELLEFSLSITLSFLAGPFILKLLDTIRTQRLDRAAMRQVKGALASADVQALGMKAEAMQKVAELALPVGAVLGAIIAAFRSFLG